MQNRRTIQPWAPNASPFPATAMARPTIAARSSTTIARTRVPTGKADTTSPSVRTDRIRLIGALLLAPPALLHGSSISGPRRIGNGAASSRSLYLPYIVSPAARLHAQSGPSGGTEEDAADTARATRPREPMRGRGRARRRRASGRASFEQVQRLALDVLDQVEFACLPALRQCAV